MKTYTIYGTDLSECYQWVLAENLTMEEAKDLLPADTYDRRYDIGAQTYQIKNI